MPKIGNSKKSKHGLKIVNYKINNLFNAPPPILSLQKRSTTTVSLEVHKGQHKYVIGPKGSNITEILELTGVSVEMPPLESPSETITLRGEQDKLGPAITLVYSKVFTAFFKQFSVFTLKKWTRVLDVADADVQMFRFCRLLEHFLCASITKQVYLLKRGVFRDLSICRNPVAITNLAKVPSNCSTSKMTSLY